MGDALKDSAHAISIIFFNIAGSLIWGSYLIETTFRLVLQNGSPRGSETGGLLSVYSWTVLQADEIKIGFATGNSCDKYHN
jgi:hypothetical protein